jgi:hypothetical protein
VGLANIDVKHQTVTSCTDLPGKNPERCRH